MKDSTQLGQPLNPYENVIRLISCLGLGVRSMHMLNTSDEMPVAGVEHACMRTRYRLHLRKYTSTVAHLNQDHLVPMSLSIADLRATLLIH